MPGVSVDVARRTDALVAAPAPPAYGWTTGEAPHTADYLSGAVEAALRAAGARDVLDAGCGNGALVAFLASRGYDILGVDGDRESVAVARVAYPGLRFEAMLFADDPKALAATPDGLFDAVVSTEVVEHLYAPHELARFAFAALRPGGNFIVSTPYHGYFKNLLLSASGHWDAHHGALWHGGHIKFWSAPTLGRLLSDAGFRVTGFKGVGRLPYLWKSMILTAAKPS